MKIRTRILTYHFLNNYGAVLFADSVQRNLNQYLENSENKILNYKDPKIRAYEWFKQFKLFPQEPFFYYKREKIFRAYRQRLKFDHQFSNTFSGQSLQKYLRKQEFDAVITGMDTWCVTNKRYRSSFPNAYWLPGELRAKKIAYAVSSYDSQPELIENNKEEIKQLVNDFSLIGVRDQFTYEMVLKYSENPSVVSLIPDPTFLYPIKKTGIENKFSELGIDPNKPMLGLLYYGTDPQIREILNSYRKKGFQIIGMSMYTPEADINLGHILLPDEWAELFGHFRFTITNRFHGTIFALRNKTPFISLQSEKLHSQKQSKIKDLLLSFGLEMLFEDKNNPTFNTNTFLEKASFIQTNWEQEFESQVEQGLIDKDKQSKEFLLKVKKIISNHSN